MFSQLTNIEIIEIDSVSGKQKIPINPERIVLKGTDEETEIPKRTTSSSLSIGVKREREDFTLESGLTVSSPIKRAK
jgi:hypothetical protein